jgi:hypothetical protein
MTLSGTPYREVALGPQVVSDGCYADHGCSCLPPFFQNYSCHSESVGEGLENVDSKKQIGSQKIFVPVLAVLGLIAVLGVKKY